MKPSISVSDPTARAAEDAAALTIWPGDRGGILRLWECRLLHRADWQYLGSRMTDPAAPWPIDSWRCERCARAWERMS
jgi:hypothetical protein